jgi:hypothetical protein
MAVLRKVKIFRGELEDKGEITGWLISVNQKQPKPPEGQRKGELPPSSSSPMGNDRAQYANRGERPL